MLHILVPEQELYDDSTNEFRTIKKTTLTLEHSLISLSKWESKYHKPFLSKENKTESEILDYIRMMVISPANADEAVACLTPDDINKICEYIEDPMTATTFSTNGEKDTKHTSPTSEQVTSELIYYWMVASQIPFECQKWHLNRLMTLIRVCSIKNAPSKKMGKRDTLNKNRALNAARRARSGSKG